MTSSEKWQLGAQVVSAAVAVWSAYLARSATKIAAKALEDQRTALKVQHRSAYFQAIVLRPSHEALMSFLHCTEAELAEGVATYRSPPAGATTSQSEAHIADMIQRFNKRFRALSLSLLTATRAWQDETLLTTVGNQLQDLQDTVVASIWDLKDSQATDDAPVTTVQENVSALMAALVRADLEPFQESEQRALSA